MKTEKKIENRKSDPGNSSLWECRATRTTFGRLLSCVTSGRAIRKLTEKIFKITRMCTIWKVKSYTFW